MCLCFRSAGGGDHVLFDFDPLTQHHVYKKIGRLYFERNFKDNTKFHMGIPFPGMTPSF